MTFPFPTVIPGSIVRSQGSALNLTGLSYFGDMTANGTLTAAFDNSTSQSSAAAAAKTTASTFAYAGATLASPKRFWSFDTYGASNGGYNNTSNVNVTVEVWAKQGSAPANDTDGTMLGTTGSIADTATSNQQTIVSSDNETLWDHVWCRITCGSSVAFRLAELVVYESV